MISLKDGMGPTTFINIFCTVQGLIGNMKYKIENNTFVLLNKDLRICPGIDTYRDSIIELYTRSNTMNPHLLIPDRRDTFTAPNVDFTKKTIIFFHGWLESSSSDNAFQTKNDYLKIEDVNVILVNNELLLAGPNYISAARNVLSIGKYVARAVDMMVEMGLDLSKLHVIGMSLGAHIAGIVSRSITTGRPARVTGLEPAGPFFYTFLDGIQKTDGDFVDIVHTNAGRFGANLEIGHLDIWVNGGCFQPGCSTGDILKMRPSLSEMVFCNHYQAFRMYVKSILNPQEYPVVKCSSYKSYLQGDCNSNERTYLGVNVNRTLRGSFYIKTGPTAFDV